MFEYDDDVDTFPICITDEAGELHPFHENDYTMTKKMKLKFTFLRASEAKTADFIWKYEMQLRISNDVSKTIHGYFKLSSEKKTLLDLATKYDEPKQLKWIKFTCFDPNNPQRRAWFIPVKGLAFTPSKKPFYSSNSNECKPSMKRTTHHIAKLQKLANRDFEHFVETPEYFNEILAVESKDLKFWLDEESEDSLMHCYFVQACSHQQNMDLLEEHYNKKGIKGGLISKEFSL